ncbi:MAG: glycoside hydrolase family 127 protein, partial [Bacteroidetes bacterium]|nr:glycoside hydrolase family 127 protein [Bacteroidota bacterium]
RGGRLSYQHDVYNAGMLIEAAVHYYKATGKVKLLNVAIKFANYMCDEIGPAPRKNVVPAHSGPEEALMKLYWLFNKNPGAKEKMVVPVNENQYYDLVRFWIEGRGNHYNRPSWGEYAQDSISVFEQKTIEGHAVRATLFATGLATTALENRNPRYIEASSTLWDNMIGKRMFITGGVGAIARGERFGPDYFLPNNAYLETCAAVGAGFFSQRMNELTGNGKYMDEFERVLYNNVLSAVSQSGDHYSYENPLIAENYARWSWHYCPCCPPMFLKMVSALPGFIYSYDSGAIYINLFIGSEAKIKFNDSQVVLLKQSTHYPWDGKISLKVEPDTKKEFSLKVRIPGWAQGIENPYGLYYSEINTSVKLSINGKFLNVNPTNGYVAITRKWRKGDVIELTLPMEPRLVHAHDSVENLKNMVALASGPLVYCFEGYDNHGLADLKIDINSPMKIKYNSNILNGVNMIEGRALVNNSTNSSNRVIISAIPFYSVGNRKPGSFYKVWIPQNK